jgi:hypothetical protein
MKYRALGILLLALALPQLGQPDWPLQVSLISLIANPEKFDGKEVMVIGYLRLEDEGDIIYVGEQDYLHSITKNGIWIERNNAMTTDIEKLDSNYVVIVGVFSLNVRGHQSSASGGIVRVTRCVQWSKPSYPITLKLRDERKKRPR